MTTSFVLERVFSRALVVDLDLTRFNDYWATIDLHIPRGGGGDHFKAGSYHHFLTEFQQPEARIWMPVLEWNGIAFSFVDGRHRCAAARDFGFTSIPVGLEGSDTSPQTPEQLQAAISSMVAERPDPRTVACA